MHGPEGGLMAVDKAGRNVRLVGVSYINPHDQVMAEMLGLTC